MPHDQWAADSVLGGGAQDLLLLPCLVSAPVAMVAWRRGMTRILTPTSRYRRVTLDACCQDICRKSFCEVKNVESVLLPL